MRIHFHVTAEPATATEEGLLSHLARIIDMDWTILKLDNIEAVVIWAVELAYEDYQLKED